MNCLICSWEIKDGDRFCSGCGKELISIRETPSDNKELYIFQGFNKARFSLSNTGMVSVSVNEIKSKGITLKGTDPVCPFSISPDSERLFLAEFDDMEINATGQMSISTSVRNINYKLRVVPVPNISIVIEGVKCEKDSIVYYESDKTILKGQIIIESYEDLVDFSIKSDDENDSPSIRLLNFESSNPIEIKESKPFDFDLEIPPDAKEETKLQFIIKSQMLGERSINVSLKEHNGPKLALTVIDEPNNLILGGRISGNIKINLENIGGSYMRILDIKPTANWIAVDWKLANQSYLININDNIELRFKIDPSKIDESSLDDADTQDNFEYTLSGQGANLIYEDIITGKKTSYFIPIEFTIKKRQPLKHPLVIDFGTTNTCAACLPNNSNNFEVVKLDATSNAIVPEELPTFIRFIDNDKNEWEFGYIAVETARTTNSRAIAKGWKQNLPDNKAYNIWDEKGRVRLYTPVRLTSIFLDNVIKTFEDHNAYKIEKVLLTYPAIFINQKDKLISAMEELGFSRKNIIIGISEPEALTLGYIAEHEKEINEMTKLNIDLRYPKEPIIHDLDNCIINENIVIALSDKNISLFESATVEVLSKGQRWRINDNEKEYILKNDNGDFRIYGEDYYFGVYDFGGGTIDITIAKLTINENFKKITVLGSDGKSGIAGNYLTHLLARMLYEKSLEYIKNKGDSQGEILPFPTEKHESIHADKKDKRYENYFEFINAAEGLKCDYTIFKGKKEKEVNIPSPLAISDKEYRPGFVVNVTKIDFDMTVRDAIRDSINILNDMIQNLFDKNELKKPSLDFLILAGNGSKLSLVEELIKENANVARIGNGEKNIKVDPQYVKIGVVRGACYYINTPMLEDEGIEIEGIKRLMYSIGYNIGNRFHEVFSEGTILDSSDPEKLVRITHPFRIHLENQPFTIYMKLSKEKNPLIFNNPQIINLGDIVISEGEKHLFIIDLADEEPLSKNGLPDKIKEYFHDNGYELSNGYKSLIIEKEKKWSIYDNKITYILKKKDSKIDVYEEYSLKGMNVQIQMQLSQENRRTLNYQLFVVDKDDPRKCYLAKSDSIELTKML